MFHPCFTHVFEEFLAVWYIAKNEITRNNASIQPHQAGEPEQHVAVHVFAMKIKGVLIQ